MDDLRHTIQHLNARRAGAILAKRKPDPDPASKRLLLLAHGVHVALFLQHLGVLGHVLGTREVVVVPRVFLAVEGGHEGRGGRAEAVPGRAREEGVRLDLFEGAVAERFVRD